MIHDGDKLTEEDRHAVAASLEYFRKGGEGVPFEQVVANLGFTVDQIRKRARRGIRGSGEIAR